MGSLPFNFEAHWELMNRRCSRFAEIDSLVRFPCSDLSRSKLLASASADRGNWILWQANRAARVKEQPTRDLPCARTERCSIKA